MSNVIATSVRGASLLPPSLHTRFAAGASLLAAASLAGWMTGLSLLTTFLPERPALSPMTATMILVGAAGAAVLPARRKIGLLLGGLQSTLGASILVAHILSVPAHGVLPAPWWSSRLSGLAFALSGVATVLLALGRFTAGQIVALGVFVFAALIGLGHVIPQADLYRFMPGTGVAIPSVLAFLALSVSQLLVCRDRGIAGALTHRSAAGKTGLLLLFAGMASVLLLAIAVMVARHHGAFDADTAVLLVAWGAVLMLGSSLWGLAVAVSRAEAARAAAEQDRDRTRHMVAAAVAHDLRNPLSAAMLTAAVLQRCPDPLRIEAAAQRLQRSHRRLDRLLRSLLDSLTVSAGRPLTLSATTCSLREVVSDVLAENDATLVERVLCEGDTQGWWDRDALFRVIENLLLNAVKYGTPASPISCRIAVEDDACVSLTVTNWGAQIPRDEWENIFQPFVRGHGHAVDGGRAGWGMGLAYARAVVMHHGGSIAVLKSDAAGTSFQLQLPADARGAINAANGPRS